MACYRFSKTCDCRFILNASKNASRSEKRRQATALQIIALAVNHLLDYLSPMRISERHRKGGSGAEGPVCAALLGLTAFLVSGCASPSPPADRADLPAQAGQRAAAISGRPNGVVPYNAAALDQPPLPIDGEGNLRGPFRTAGLTSVKPDAQASGTDLPLASASYKPDSESYRLPSLPLATDGPLSRLLAPTNEGPWSPDQAVLPWAEFHDDLVTVHNIRNCQYRTVDDYTVRLYSKTYDLRRLTSIDLIVVPFDDRPQIAHVAISFGFEDRDFLVTSVEVRRRAGQKYDTVSGFFNQFTLMYVLADERDIIWRETTGFLCEVYVYRTRATPKQSQEMFVDVLRRVNKLAREPEFYNTVTNNCTTNIRNHVNRLLPDKVPYDYRVLLPGYAPNWLTTWACW